MDTEKVAKILHDINNAFDNPNEGEGADILRKVLSQTPNDFDVQVLSDRQSQFAAPWPSQYNALTWAIDMKKVSALGVILEFLRERRQGIKSGGTREQNPIHLAIANRNVKTMSGRLVGKEVFDKLLSVSTLGELSAPVG